MENLATVFMILLFGSSLAALLSAKLPRAHAIRVARRAWKYPPKD